MDVSEVVGTRNPQNTYRDRDRALGPAFGGKLELRAGVFLHHNASNGARRLGTVGVADDANALEEARQLERVARVQVARVHGGDVPTLKAQKLEADIEDVARLVHGAGRDVDVDQHAADGRTDRLEVTAPEDDARPDVLSLMRREERAGVEWITAAKGMVWR